MKDLAHQKLPKSVEDEMEGPGVKVFSFYTGWAASPGAEVSPAGV